MSLLDTLDPSFKPAAQQLYDLAQRAGVHPKVTSARRSYALQARLYERFQQGRSRYPVAPPGTSAHEFGLAFDMVVPNPTDQHDLGTVWVSWGGVYGGVQDPVHFEAPGFKTEVPSAPLASDSQSIRDTAGQLADLLAGYLPPPLGGIVGTASIAHAILLVLNQEANPLAFATWALSHPFEFFDKAFAAIWATLWYEIFG